MCQSVHGVVAGGPIRVATGNLDKELAEIANETKVDIATSEEGIYIKADAIGSLKALAFECKNAEDPDKEIRP